MFCDNCGNKLDDNAKFCDVCGTVVASAKEPDTGAAAPTVSETKDAEKKQNSKKEKKKFPVGLVVTLAVIALLITGIIFAAVKMLPLEVEVKEPKVTSTTNGVIKNVSMTFDANQPIQSVKYAVDPADPENLELYTEVDCEGGMFSKTMTIESLKVLPGKVTLYVYVDALFGEYEHKVEFTCKVGYTTAPDLDAITTLDDGTSVVGNELIVCFSDGVSSAEAKKTVESCGGKVVGAVYTFNQYQVRFEDSNVYDLDSKIETFTNQEHVRAVFYNVVYSDDVSATPNDSEYDGWDVSEPSGNNWHLECIDAPGAWEHQDEMNTVKVGVIDSTLHYSHEDITVDSTKGCFLPTDDFKTLADLMNYYKECKDTHECIDPEDCDFCDMKDHGTHVSGIIGANANNGKGVAGVNWNADLYFSNAWYYYKPSEGQLDRRGTIFNYSYSIAYLVMSECRVVNLSIGSSFASSQSTYEIDMAEEYDHMIERLENAGYDFLIVKAAGNDNGDASRYQLNRIMTYGEHARAHTLVVAAVDHTDFNLTPFDIIPTQYSVASYSNYGSLVDIAAPGSSVYSTVYGGYRNMSGTSMAAPMVSGVASLLYSAEPDITYDRVKAILCSQVEDHTAKGGRSYPIVNAKLAVEYLLNNEDVTPVVTEPEVGFITGIVQDADTGEILENAVVSVTNNATGEVIVAEVLNNGNYYLYADEGTYTMYFRAEGYLDETVYNVEVTNGVVKYNVLLNLVANEGTLGTSSGRVIDAFDAASIPNAQIIVYKGIGNVSGIPVATTVADGSGRYTLSLAPGNYTLQVSAENYLTGTATVVIIGNETKSNQDCTLTPILNEGEMRVVLTWGQYPKDLDSHLVGPTVSGGEFHTYFEAKNHYYDNTKYVNLDVDDTTSYGPETTSVYVGIPGGTYTFYIHDYTNRGKSFSNEMSTSGATVKVYLAGQAEPYVFYAPNEEGTLWKVFSVTDGVLTPINEMGYESSASAVGQE